jgi:hypothetical protein
MGKTMKMSTALVVAKLPTSITGVFEMHEVLLTLFDSISMS